MRKWISLTDLNLSEVKTCTWKSLEENTQKTHHNYLDASEKIQRDIKYSASEFMI